MAGRVVREHAQRNDQRAQRDPLHQQIPLHVHHEERAHNREKQHDADDEPRLAAHCQQQHDKDDRDRLAQVEHEFVGGLRNRFGLKVNLADLDADGLLAFQFREFLPHAFAHRHDIAALHRGDSQADGRLTVVAEHAPRRVLVASLNRGDIAQKELPARAIRTDHELEHVLGRVEPALRIERNVLVSDAYAATVGGDVSRLELGVDLLFVDS